MSHVLTKSAKGLREASGKTHDLPEELREVLKLCRGQFVAEDLVAGVPDAGREATAKALLALTETGYLREVAEIAVEGEGGGDEEGAAGEEAASVEEIVERRVTPVALPLDGVERRQTDDLAHQLRAEFAARRGQRDEESTERMRAAEEAARMRAQEKTRKDVEEKARIEAEERARREAEARARIEAEEKARLEVLERERVEAEEQSRRDAAERTRRSLEERAKREAAEKARREAAEKARREEEERELEAMRERIRQRQLGRRRVLAPIIILALLVPVGALWGIGTVPMSGKRDEFARKATELTGLPVKIGAARFVVFPSLQWQLDDVAFGEGDSQVKVHRVDVSVPVSALWSMPEHVSRVHFEAPAVPAAALFSLLSRTPTATLPIDQLTAGGLVLIAKTPLSPPLTLSAKVESGRITGVSAQGANDEFGKFAVSATPADTSWQLAIESANCHMPFGLGVGLTACTLKATPKPNALDIGEFTGRLHRGEVAYAGKLSWQGGWQTSGRIELRRVDASSFAPVWFKDGFIDAAGELVSEAAGPDQLLAGMRVAGRFTIAPGTLAGIDLDRTIQGRGTGEQTRFEALEGSVLIEGGRAELSGVHLRAGAMTAEGALVVEPDKAIHGHLNADVNLGGGRMGAAMNLIGQIDKPQYQK